MTKPQSDLKVPVIFENDNFLVFDKPSGVVVNKSQTTSEPTLADVAQNLMDVNEGDIDDIESDFYSRGGIVHRLDKDTSGIVLAAKNEYTFQKLQLYFKQRKVTKSYLAVCYGHMKPDEIVVTAPIGRNPKNRFKFAVVDGTKEAKTSFTKLNAKELEGMDYTLVSAKPLTGRTHQIRVHLAALNLPVASDPIYLGKKTYDKTIRIFPRLMLHASELSFYDVDDKKEYSFKSPTPSEFKLIE